MLPADTFDLDADGDVDEMLPVDFGGNPRVQNGIVDMGVYERFVQPAFPADLNGDGFVGSADLDIVRANWGRTVLPWSLLDGDATSASGGVYGPPRPSESPAGAEGATGALFATRRDLAEAAWMAAVEGLKTRRKERTDRAVDAVMLQWEAR